MPTWTAKFAEAFRSIERAASTTFRHKIRSTPFPEKNGGIPFNASGVVQVGPHRFVFIDNHDSSALFEFSLGTNGVEAGRIRRRRLLGIADVNLGDPEGLTGVDVDGAIVLITTSSLSVASAGGGHHHINDGLVRVRYSPNGDLHPEAMTGFRSWLLAHDSSLAKVGELEPDAGGLNVEGLSWDPRSNALMFGLRGPAKRGQVTVVKVPVDVGGASWTTAALSTPSILTIRIPQSTVIQGIRDICYDKQAGEFLILIGRSLSRGDEPFQLCGWDGTSDSVTLSDLKFHQSMKPEGITTFWSGGKKKILVVDDCGGYAVFNAHHW